MITTVFFKKDSDPGYRKAMVNSCDVEFFLALGAQKTPEFDEEPEQYVDDIKVGCGRPGSLEWNITAVRAKKGKAEILKIVTDVTGRKIKTSGRIDYVKKRAIKAIEAHYDNN